jgi:hypothetical protein
MGWVSETILNLFGPLYRWSVGRAHRRLATRIERAFDSDDPV